MIASVLVLLAVIFALAVRQAVRAEQREAEFRRNIRRLYGGD